MHTRLFLLPLLLATACKKDGAADLVEDSAGSTPNTTATATGTSTGTGTGTGAATGTGTGTGTGPTTGTGTGAGTGTGTGTTPMFTVTWSGNDPTSDMDLAINDPLGRTSWNFGIAETSAGGVGWYGEDCYLGTGPFTYCHPVSGTSLHLDQTTDINAVAPGQTTLFWSGMDLTYYADDGTDCWTWGDDPSYYGTLGCTVIGAGGTVIPGGRRGGCSGMDPADPAGSLGGKVALTFDDGPSATVTPQVMAVLTQYNIPATFFLLGAEAADPNVWPIIDDMVASPLFTVASHSWDHADHTTLSTQQVRDQMVDTDALLQTWGIVPPYYRFPYGNSSCTSADIARNDYNYLVAGWHADTADWCYATGVTGQCTPNDYWRITPGYENDMIGYVEAQLTAFDGGVVLMHDIHQYTADSLETLILTLQASGFTFTSLDDALTFPNFNADTPYDYPWMGEGCDTTNDTCWQVEWNSWCEPTNDPAQPANSGICVLPCDGNLLCIDRDGTAPLHCADAGPGTDGYCLSQAGPINNYCADVPGSVNTNVPEWNGTAPFLDTCVPYAW